MSISDLMSKVWGGIVY